MLPEKKHRRDVFLEKISAAYPSVIISNSESDRTFLIRDFKNDDHLGPEGAEKYSAQIDRLLFSQKR
jgi:hypothetical protein